MKTLLAILAAVVIVAAITWAQSTTTYEGSLVATSFTGDVVGDVTGDLTGDVTGDVTGGVTGAVVATTITASSTTVLSGAFDARSTAEFAGAVICSSTVAFQDSVNFGDDVVATTFTGALTGAVTGNVAGDLTGSAAGPLGNFALVEADTIDMTGFAAGVGTPALPSASVHTGRFATNAAADSLYWSDGTNWQQIVP